MTGSGTPRRGVVAFDNTGTLSRSVVKATDVSERGVSERGVSERGVSERGIPDRAAAGDGGSVSADFDAPVPDIPASRPAALVSLALDDYGRFDTAEPLGWVVESEAIPVHLALSNVDTTAEAAREALLAEDAVPARTVVEQVETLTDRVAAAFGADSPPIGVQLVVDLDAGRVRRVVAYTTRPRSVAAEVVGRVRDLGYEPHILSGDATHILRGVADAVAIPLDRVHAYQSADGKASVVDDLRVETDGDVVMVGDYVNDRHAFEAADVAVLVNECGEPDEMLARRVDAVVDGLEDVPGFLSET